MPQSTRQREKAATSRAAHSPLEVINPATETLVATYDQHRDSEIDSRLDRAVETFHRWQRTLMADRQTLMRRVAELLRERSVRYATLMTIEMGKPITQAEAEIDKCASLCDYYVAYAQGFVDPLPKARDVAGGASKEVHFEPLGPVLAIMPWNFPFWQVFRFAVPNLMAGNVGVLKHAANVSGTALAIEELFADAGFPEGAMTTLLLSSERMSRVIAHDAIRAVTLTGSERAGVAVATEAGKHLKKTVLELGGSDPFIVLDDANVERVAKYAAQARTVNTGQSCIAAKRFIVDASITDRFQAALAQEMQRLQMDDPLQSSTEIGPLARKDLVETLDSQVQRSREAGAELITGGHPATVRDKGYYYAPTVLGNCDESNTDMAAFAEETFGPVALVVRAANTDQAVELANRSRYGLGASIWTENPERGKELARRIEAGNVFVNEIVKSDPVLPFGGIKKSGYGRELADFGIREFLNIKSVWVSSPR